MSLKKKILIGIGIYLIICSVGYYAMYTTRMKLVNEYYLEKFRNSEVLKEKYGEIIKTKMNFIKSFIPTKYGEDKYIEDHIIYTSDGDKYNLQLVYKYGDDFYAYLIDGKLVYEKKHYTKEEVKNSVYEFPYTNLLNGKNTYEEMWDAYKFESVYKYLKIDTEKEVELNKNNLDKEKDANGETYGNYSQSLVKEVAKAAGLTVKEMENLDNLFLWSKIVGIEMFTYFFTIDGESFKNAYIKLYGNDNMFNESVLVGSSILNGDGDYSNSKMYLYDKNINKVIVRKDMELFGTKRVVEIINEEENNNEYIIEFVEGKFIINPEFELKNYILENTDIEVDNLDDINELRKMVKDNQEKLKKYKVIFNKNKKGYTYKSVS